MTDSIRTFIAVKIIPGQKLLDQLRELKVLFKDERISWVPEDNFHLTLRFLGETSKEQLPDLHYKLTEISTKLGSFDIQIFGTGFFGSKGDPRVVFVNIRFPEELKKMAEEIEKAVVSAGFHEERKPFRPHLTLGRIKHLSNRTKFIQAMMEFPQKDYQTDRVSEFILFQSILSPEGPVYKLLNTYFLS